MSTKMIPITVLPIIYVLKLENDKFYIGITYNLNFRYAQHLAGEGANWTVLHKPIKIHEVHYNPTFTENEKTIEYIGEFGFDNVGGGSWCRLEYKNEPEFD